MEAEGCGGNCRNADGDGGSFDVDCDAYEERCVRLAVRMACDSPCDMLRKCLECSKCSAPGR